jgi:RNA polymerase sigma-70 factor, ECF subfamily
VSLPQRLSYHGPEWIGRIRSGDEAAFESLFRAFAPGLCVVAARYVQSRAVAEELVQDLFLELWTRRETLVVEQTIGAYLSTAMRNRSLNHLRRENRLALWRDEVGVAGSGDGFGNADASAPNEAALLDALELQDAIAQLPARCRLIFTLNRHQEMTYAEIATSLGLSIKTVETQMGRALKALRERLRHMLP